MNWPQRTAISIATIIMVAIAAVAGADQWNDRTKLTFDAPIMIPGTTLAPGTYTFKLMDSPTSRQIVQIYNEDGTKLISTTNAVPAKRMDTTGDTVLKFNPTEAGAPVALKAWFYPGSRYGHEFVYPDKQARDIAQRTKTVVLSQHTPGDSDGKGIIYTYDAQGLKSGRKTDEAMISEWREWDAAGRKSVATVVTPGGRDSESTAPMLQKQPSGMSVPIGELEEHPNQYIGKTIAVTGEVDDVLGPRLFKIDESNWADLDGEILVSVPSPLAATVREEDRVTVTGTVKMATKVDIDRDLGWLDVGDDVVARFTNRPVLIASSVVGGNSNVALVINVTNGAQNTGSKAVGTSGSNAAATVTDVSAIGSGDRELVGRRVDVDNVKVQRTGEHQGFWVEAGANTLFVLPGENAGRSAATVGKSVSIEGIVLRMPRGIRDAAADVKNANEDIYVLATSVK